MKKTVKKLVLAKETVRVLGGYLGDLPGLHAEYTKTCITCYASCVRTDCYCPAPSPSEGGTCVIGICIPL